MRSHPKTARIALYFAVGTVLCLAAAGLKVIATWAAETYLYSLPLVGGLMASLEVVEVATVLLVLVLGVCLGALSLYLPAAWGLGPKLVLLVLALPLVIAVGYVTRHALWVRQVAVSTGVSPGEARTITDGFLQREVGAAGEWGYYRYTAEVPQPPVQLDNFAMLSTDDVVILQEQLSEISGVETGLFSRLFDAVGWLIRLVYLAIAALLGLIYFFKGKLWADRRA